jgi:hypothetical protein
VACVLGVGLVAAAFPGLAAYDGDSVDLPSGARVAA